MNRVAFSIFGLDIMWYGILIATGILIGTVLAVKEAKKVGYKSDDILDLLLWAIPSAVIGARLYYVIFSWGYYKGNIIEIFAIRDGGLAIHGAIIGSFIAGYIFVKKRGLSLAKLADITAPSLILGQAIGRWGNFMNQEAHGGPVSKAFISHFPKFIQNQMYINGQYFHPTFLYESIWDILAFTLLIVLRKYKKRDGEIISLYLVLYSIGRFVIEGMRTDSLMLGQIRIAQLISLGFIFIGTIFLVYTHFNHKKSIN